MTQVVQVVLDLLTPMQGFLRDLAVFMLFVELGKLVHAEPVVALDLVLYSSYVISMPFTVRKPIFSGII